MLESVMLVAAGFLAACLLALAFAPVQWRRAVRLTEQRIRAHTPLSMAEIQADKDRVRAEFALALRRLEKTIDRLRADNVALRARLSRAADAAAERARGTAEGPHPADAADSDELREEIARLRKAAEASGRTLAEAEEKLRARARELEQARSSAREALIRVDEQKVQIAALTTRLASDEERLRRYDRPGRLFLRRGAAAASAPAQQDAAGDAGGEGTGNAGAELALARAELSARLVEIDELKRKLAAGERAGEDLRRRLETFEALVSTGGADVDSRLAPLAAARDAAEAEKARLAAEVEVLRRELADARERDRGETDLLRDRLAEIAAKVAYMSMAIEGGDPIVEKILREGRAESGAAGAGPATRTATLADRIRALKTGAADRTGR